MASAQADTDRSRLVELDALRGIAAVVVVLYHLTYWNDAAGQAPFSVFWGHYGVELFFIISGFVIFMTLAQARDLRAFAVSRVARLYPAYWCGVVITSCVAWATETSAPSVSTVLTNLSMLQEFFQIRDVDGSYWTLAIELEFYLAIALLFYFKLITRIVDVLLVALLVAHGAQLGIAWLGLPLPSVLQVGLVQYGPFFAIGISLYLLRTNPVHRGAIAVIALALLYTCWDGPPGVFPPRPADYSVVALCLVGTTWLALNGWLKLLRWPVLLWFGQISYPLYLIHQRIGSDMMLALHRRGVPGAVVIAVAFVAITALAWAIHVWIETPARRAIRSALQREVPAGRDTSGGH